MSRLSGPLTIDQELERLRNEVKRLRETLLCVVGKVTDRGTQRFIFSVLGPIVTTKEVSDE